MTAGPSDSLSKLARCGSCGAPIYWLKNTTTGKPAPIDAEPSDKGNIAAYPVEGEYDVLGRDAAAAIRQNGLLLHTNHFMTCPSAASWKKRGGRQDTKPRRSEETRETSQ